MSTALPFAAGLLTDGLWVRVRLGEPHSCIRRPCCFSKFRVSAREPQNGFELGPLKSLNLHEWDGKPPAARGISSESVHGATDRRVPRRGTRCVGSRRSSVRALVPLLAVLRRWGCPAQFSCNVLSHTIPRCRSALQSTARTELHGHNVILAFVSMNRPWSVLIAGSLELDVPAAFAIPSPRPGCE